MDDRRDGHSAAPTVNRRAAIAIGAAVAMAGGAAKAAPLQLGRVEDDRLIYRKLRFRTDSGLLFWWVRGPYFGNVDGELTPLYAINLGAIQRVTQRPDGGFDFRSLEVTFKTDIDTGKRLEAFRNPLTGEILPIDTPTPTPLILRYSKDNGFTAPTEVNGEKLEAKHLPSAPFAVGTDVYCRDRAYVRISQKSGPVLILNEMSTFNADLRTVLDPAVVTAPTRLISNDVANWAPWLKMGDRPGIMTLYGVGQKVGSYDELPNDWRAMVAQVFPKIASDPIAALDGESL